MELIVDKLTLKRGQQYICKLLSFILAPGQLISITGNNGSGKTSLLKAIIGILHIDKGNILWDGIPTKSSLLFKNQIHYIGHTLGFKNGLSVTENLTYYAAIKSNSYPTKLIELLKIFNLHKLAHIPLEYLSAGQQQKVKIIKLMLNNSILWILDEPFNSLDDNAKLKAELLINQHLVQGGMAIIASHIDYNVENLIFKQSIVLPAQGNYHKC